MNFFKKILFILLLCQFNSAYTQVTETMNARLDMPVLTSGTPLEVTDNRFNGTDFNGSLFTNVSSQIILEFGIDPTLRVFHDPSISISTSTVQFNYVLTDVNGVVSSPITSTLSVTYHPTNGQKDQDKSFITYSNKYQISVYNIFITTKDQSGSVISNPQDLYMKAEVQAQRVLNFDPYTPPSISTFGYNILTVTNPNTGNVQNNELDVFWDYIHGADEYELEWTYIDNYDASGLSANKATSAIMYDFKHDASRAITKEQHYKVPIVYEKGLLLFRMRAIHYDINGNRIEGVWTAPDNLTTNTVDQFYAYFTGTNTFYYEVNPFESDLINWTCIRTFAENGKSGTGIDFQDGLLFSRESIAKSNTDDKIVSHTTLYDFQGRPIIQTLPSPVNEPSAFYSYKHKLNMYSSTSQYDKYSFDKYTGTACASGAQAMDANNSIGSANYYSTSNTYQEGFQGLVPDSKGFPFTQVEYVPDNTTRISRQSLPGIDHQLFGTGNHDIKYYYTQPSQNELVAMFGSEVGPAQNYHKTIQVDPHGQSSVTYTDKDGQVIATALAGGKPSNVDAINSYNTMLPQSFTENLNVFNTADPSDHSYVMTKDFFASQNEVQTISYDFTAPSYNDACAPLCFDCLYELDLSLKDDCGNDLFPPYHIFVGSPVGASGSSTAPTQFTDSTCADGTTYVFTIGSGGIPVTFPKDGTYHLYKKITLSTLPAATYAQMFINNNTCIKTLEQFQQDDLSQVNLTGCSSITCASCSTSVNSYVSAHPGMLSENQVQQLLDQCNALCTSGNSSCESKTQEALNDLMPGGQYATYDPNTFTSSDPYSVLNSSNSLNVSTSYWCLNPPDVYSPSSVYIPTNDPPLTPVSSIDVPNYISFYNNSWANALLKLHPEYCKLALECSNELSSSKNFDNGLLNTQTCDDAYYSGYLNPFGSSCSSMANGPALCTTIPPCSTSVSDPIFSTSSISLVLASGTYNVDLTHITLANPTPCSYFNAITLNTIPSIYGSTPPSITGNIYQLAISFATGLSVSQVISQNIQFGADPCYNDMEWQIFKALYTYQKQLMYNDIMKELPIGTETGCLDVTVSGFASHNFSLIFQNQDPQTFSTSYTNADVTGDASSQPNTNTATQMAASCSTMCAQYINTWVQNMQSCINSSNTAQSGLDMNSILQEMAQNLNVVCAAGCDADNPFGASDVDPTSPGSVAITINNGSTVSTYNVSDFQGVFNAYYTTYSGAFDQLTCNSSLIPMPEPRGHSYSSTTSTQPHLDPCGCDAVLTNHQNYSTALGMSEEEYFYLTYNVHIPNYSTVVCACNQALLNEYGVTTNNGSSTYNNSTYLQQSFIDAVLAPSTNPATPNFYASANIVPFSIGCKNCRHCSDINPTDLLSALQVQFGSTVTSLNDIVNLPLPQDEITNWLNGYYNLNNTYTEWVTFLGTCSVINTSTLPPVSYPLTAQAQAVLPALNEMIADDFAVLDTPPLVMTGVKYPYTLTSALMPTGFTGSTPASCHKLVLTTSSTSTPNEINIDINSPTSTCLPNVNIHINLYPSPYSSSPPPIYFTYSDIYAYKKTNMTKFYDFNWICQETGQNIYFTVKCDYYNSSNVLVTQDFIGTLSENTVPVAITVGNPCNGGTICAHDFNTPPVPYQNDCLSSLINNAMNNATTDYQNYITAQIDAFITAYENKCYSALTENITRAYSVQEYQHTLYYHDQGGNLVHTVPPKGVKLITGTTDINNAIAYVTGTSTTPLYPCHSLNNVSGGSVPIVGSCGNFSDAHYVSNYTYNSLEEPLTSSSPDGGGTNYFYDNVGRIVASQNAQQASDLRYSYTLYDLLGRITETGRLQLSIGGGPGFLTPAIAADPTQWNTYVNSVAHMEVSKVYYDNSLNTTINSQFGSAGQENLRNRVATSTYEDVDDGNPNTYNYATHFSYDRHGNVKHLIEDNPSLTTYNTAFEYKHIEYEYELISGNMVNVIYQRNQSDQMLHKYYYDPDNRLLEVYTSNNGVMWDKDEKYLYYQHGALARTETGANQVHGCDYAYTIHGWVKGINSNVLQIATDIGKDGDVGNNYISTYAGIHKDFAKDAASYNLNYYGTDYSPIKASTGNFIADKSLIATTLNTNAPDLFNGNISSMVTSVYDADPTSGDYNMVKPQLSQFRYDQLHRITQSKSYSTFGHYLSAANDAINLSTNQWNTITTANNKGAYQMSLGYDDNGNILSMLRQGKYNTTTNTLEQMDDFTYNYNTNKNQLQYINDGTYGGGYDATYKNNYNNDIDNQSSGNYQYDAIGQLIADASEEIAQIDWTTAHKVKDVIRTSTSTKDDIYYDYDAFGRRIKKTAVRKAPDGTVTSYSTVTHYVLDADGNQMGIYSEFIDQTGSVHYLPTVSVYALSELEMYGNKRVGSWQHNVTLWTYGGAPAATTDPPAHIIGEKMYEIGNHLGNVLTVVTDRKLQDDFGADNGANNTVDYYTPDIASVTDYYAFGMAMPGRSYNSNLYRFGFNDKENDQEWSSGAQDYGMREYDDRSGRFMSVDPLTTQYPWWTPYQFAGNMPIKYIDLDGMEPEEAPAEEGQMENAEMTHPDENGRMDENNHTWVGKNGKWENQGVTPSEGGNITNTQKEGGALSNNSKNPEPSITNGNKTSNEINQGGVQKNSIPAAQFHSDVIQKANKEGTPLNNSNNAIFNIDNAVKWLNNNAHESWKDAKGKCATYIKFALDAGGLNTTGHPVAARQYSTFLPKLGFSEVNNSGNYMKGDIAVIQGYPGGTSDPKTGIPYGHVQMFNGSQWISDFKQTDFWPGGGYRKNKPVVQIFRWDIHP